MHYGKPAAVNKPLILFRLSKSCLMAVPLGAHTVFRRTQRAGFITSKLRPLLDQSKR